VIWTHYPLYPILFHIYTYIPLLVIYIYVYIYIYLFIYKLYIISRYIKYTIVLGSLINQL
jgi:hypothetical protein